MRPPPLRLPRGRLDAFVELSQSVFGAVRHAIHGPVLEQRDLRKRADEAIGQCRYNLDGNVVRLICRLGV